MRMPVKYTRATKLAMSEGVSQKEAVCLPEKS